MQGLSVQSLRSDEVWEGTLGIIKFIGGQQDTLRALEFMLGGTSTIVGWEKKKVLDV